MEEDTLNLDIYSPESKIIKIIIRNDRLEDRSHGWLAGTCY